MSEEHSHPKKKDFKKRHAGTELVIPAQAFPDKLFLLPATNRPFFPAQVQPLVFNAVPWAETLVKVAATEQKMLGICYINAPKSAVLEDENLAEHFPLVGCSVKAHNMISSEDKLQFIALGLQRFKIVRWIQRKPPYLAQVRHLYSADEKSNEVRAYAMALINTIKELIPLNPLYNEELRNYLNRFNPNDPSPLADFAAAITTAPASALQEVLETVPVLRRMEKVLILLKKELEVAKLQSELSAEVNRRISENQREFFLKEQLKVIQKELGISKDDRTADIESFEKRLQKLAVPELALKKIQEELEKLAILETGSTEYAITRNYLDWATSIPWGLCSKDKLDLKRARKILDQDHDGLADVKDRIIEFLGVGAYKGELSGSIILLLGPPGVGKTSIGHSIANALGRTFFRFSLGGMRDEAEIKGHRRTYIGAMPGKLIQALKDVAVANPVIMLDEIDKVGHSYRGDPASALLEVLDPEQNSAFLDHYLDLHVDLSKVLFICTANQQDTIPSPLLDRMDTIRLSGYITQEKIEIARNHLWPKQLDKAGIAPKKLKIHKKALRLIIENYARESGVRQLEKQLNRIVRKSAVKLLSKDRKISIQDKNLEEYLGPPYFSKEQNMQGVGIVTGLAWTALGGATLAIEASLIHKQKAGFKLTGKLGEVMRESAEIAYSFTIANAQNYGIEKDYFKDAFIHLHIPEGATPKDGPSAGITMASALFSLALNKKPKHMAMTGELTLTGQVLAVGGIREKVIAARRAKLRTLIIPRASKRDYDQLPDYLKDKLTIHFAETYLDVFQVSFSR